MTLSSLFPAEYRAFCCGPLSVCVERFGGINSLNLLDSRDFEGKTYPERFPIPWLNREGETMGRPLYSPGLMLFHNDKQYVPADAKLYPFGFQSPDYSMVLSSTSMAFVLAAHEGETFAMNLSSLHMPSGQMESMKNQLAVKASGIQWLPPELRGPGFDSAKPFPENGMMFTRKEPVFAKERLVFEAECQYQDHTKHQFWVITWKGEAAFQDIPNGWSLNMTMGAEPLELRFGFGSTLEEALANGSRSFAETLQDRLGTCQETLEASFEELPEATEFFRLFPGYQRNMILSESEREMSTRAAAAKYGLFVLWDQIYPARDYLLMGEPDRAKKSLRYILNYPWAETCPWITIQMIPAIGEYLGFRYDREFLAECMPYFKRYLEFNLRFTDERTGLLQMSLNAGTDCSAEAGLIGLFYPSCLNGWWYDSLRTLENLARDMGETETAAQCLEISRKIEAHYEEFFFDEKVGYLRAARKQNGDIPEINIYQNTHTIGMDYAYGAYLFRKILPKLAEFQATKLYNPMGHVAVSNDSQVPCEMWKSVHMNQHLGHECKTARQGGLAREAQRVMEGYLDYFTTYQCAIETFNLAGCPNDSKQQGEWQTFSATGAAQGLVCGVAGWQKDRGGWKWYPGDTTPSVIRNLDGKTFTVTGKGTWAQGLTLDGELVAGTLQMPADRTATDITVVRQDAMPAGPVLLSATDAPVTDVSVTDGVLRFRVNASVHTHLCVSAPSEPTLTCNGQVQAVEWQEGTHELWWDHIFNAGDRIDISCRA